MPSIAAMRIESVEIYSDASNAAVLRHPQRRFPGCLVQGDTLHTLLQSLRVVQLEADHLSEEALAELLDVIDRLDELLRNYKGALSDHGIELPFHEAP
jgi:predicted RNase H-like HicB family nuclease